MQTTRGERTQSSPSAVQCSAVQYTIGNTMENIYLNMMDKLYVVKKYVQQMDKFYAVKIDVKQWISYMWQEYMLK